MKEANGVLKPWQADSDQSPERYRSMLQNWFGLELKPHGGENVLQYREASLPEGNLARGSFPSVVYLSLEISFLSTYQYH